MQARQLQGWSVDYISQTRHSCYLLVCCLADRLLHGLFAGTFETEYYIIMLYKKSRRLTDSLKSMGTHFWRTAQRVGENISNWLSLWQTCVEARQWIRTQRTRPELCIVWWGYAILNQLTMLYSLILRWRSKKRTCVLDNKCPTWYCLVCSDTPASVSSVKSRDLCNWLLVKRPAISNIAWQWLTMEL